MVEEFSEFDESHLTIISGHFHYLTPESLAERMGGEMLNVFQHILHLDLFQDNIDPLDREHITVAVEEALLVSIFYIQCRITLFEMLAYTGIDLYLSVLSRLLLVENEAFAEYLFPRKGEKVADAKTEEAATSDEKAHPVSAIFEQSVRQVQHRVPRQVIRCCV